MRICSLLAPSLRPKSLAANLQLFMGHHTRCELPAIRLQPFLCDRCDLCVRKFRSPIAERLERLKGRTHAKAAKAAKEGNESPRLA
jgi:hypothetical protein